MLLFTVKEKTRQISRQNGRVRLASGGTVFIIGFYYHENPWPSRRFS